MGQQSKKGPRTEPDPIATVLKAGLALARQEAAGRQLEDYERRIVDLCDELGSVRNTAACELEPAPHTAQELPRDDEERVLLFEWQARQFEVLHDALPEIPSRTNMLKTSPAVWESLILQFSLIRKFLTGNDGVRLDRVWKSMKALAETVTSPNSKLIEDIDFVLKTQWPNMLKSGLKVVPNGNAWPVQGQWLAMLLYGATLHSDVDKARQLMSYGADIGFPMWSYWYSSAALYTTPAIILTTLRTIQESRRNGDMDLDDPWPPIWPEPDD